MRAKVVGLK